MVGIKESTIDAHLEHLLAGELGPGELSVVSGDTSEEWDLFLRAIELQVLVGGGVDEGFGGRGHLIDNLWNDCTLQKWNQHVGDLGYETTGECDIDVIWIHRNFKLLGFERWSKFIGWSTLLSAGIDLNVNTCLVDRDICLSISSDEQVFEGKVSSDMCCVL